MKGQTIDSSALLASIGNRIDALELSRVVEAELDSSLVGKFEAAIAELRSIERQIRFMEANSETTNKEQG
jgi:hypothetical protein